VLASEPAKVKPPLLGRHLDLPALGVFDGDLVLSGWALSARGPYAHIVASSAGTHLAQVRPDRSRPDIARAFPDVRAAEFSGFRIRIPAVVCAELRDLVLTAQDAGGEATPIWRLELSTPMHPIGAAPEEVARPPSGWARRFSRPSSPSAAEQANRTSDDGGSSRQRRLLPDGVRTLALISTFNEADVIDSAIDHLTRNGVMSYVLDDGSTDDTVARAKRWLGDGLLGIEQLARPADGRTSWRSILDRKIELAGELGADWYMHHDADEFRESPWPGLSLGDAIAWVDLLGYNAIDFRVLNFRPVDDGFRPGADPRAHFTRYEDAAEYDRLQRKCWKAGFPDTVLAEGGHDVRFPERRLFPIRFLMRHYPIRSHAHGRRKVLSERRNRFSTAEVAFGWHRQYDSFVDESRPFLWNPALLRDFDLDRLRLETMLEIHEPGPEPEPVDPGPATTNGNLELVTREQISGWAGRTDGGHEPVEVQLWDGGRQFATVRAELPRPDLEQSGIAGRTGGFRLRTPSALLDGAAHWIWATVSGSGAALQRCPLVLQVGGRISIGPPTKSRVTAEIR
jgi:hypothetical protein